MALMNLVNHTSSAGLQLPVCMYGQHYARHPVQHVKFVKNGFLCRCDVGFTWYATLQGRRPARRSSTT